MADSVKPNDIIVVVIGPTGAGKSTFIGMATGKGAAYAGHSLEAHTTQVRSHRVQHPTVKDHEIVLVDTPGFDDQDKSDLDILEMVSEWLKTSYGRNVEVSLIIYMHRITDNRLASKPYTVFHRLCGEGAMRNLILATTMWGNMSATALGEEREKELRDVHWKTMLAHGSIIKRFHNTYESAWDVLGALDRPPVMFLAPDQLRELKSNLPPTGDAIALYDRLQTLLVEQRKTIEKLELAAEAADANLVQQLTKKQEEIHCQIRTTLEELRNIKVPLGLKVLGFFGLGKKGRALASQ